MTTKPKWLKPRRSKGKIIAAVFLTLALVGAGTYIGFRVFAPGPTFDVFLRDATCSDTPCVLVHVPPLVHPGEYTIISVIETETDVHAVIGWSRRVGGGSDALWGLQITLAIPLGDRDLYINDRLAD